MGRLLYNYPVIARLSVRKLSGCFRSSSGYQQVGPDREPYESGLERDYFIQVSGHPDFLRLTWNPIELEYVDSRGKVRTYTPDALVQYRIGSSLPPNVLVELKYREELKADLNELRERFYAARDYVDQFDGWKFEVRTERSIYPEFVSNVSFLSRYKKIQIENQDPDYPHQLFQAIRERGRVTPEYLLSVCFSSFEERAVALPYLWAMIAQRVIACDWYSMITMRSPLWIPS